MLMHAFSSKGGGGAGPLGFAKGGGGAAQKLRNRAAAVTGPHLDLVTFHSIIAHATPQANPLKLINLHITDVQ